MTDQYEMIATEVARVSGYLRRGAVSVDLVRYVVRPVKAVGTGKAKTIEGQVLDDYSPSLVSTDVAIAGRIRMDATENSSNPISVVNINTADFEELSKIPGIAEKLATRILTHRQKYGKFQHIEDLLEVPRIGKKTMDKISFYITFS